MSTLGFATWLDGQLQRRGAGAADDLADAVEVSTATVSRWRTGVNRPARDRWPMIEDALGLRAGTLAEMLVQDRRQPAGLDVGVLERIADALERIADVLVRGAHGATNVLVPLVVVAAVLVYTVGEAAIDLIIG